VPQVSNLDADCADGPLRELFSAAVPVLDVRLVMEKFSGMPRGFAFVEYEHSPDATRAMNMLQVRARARVRACACRTGFACVCVPHRVCVRVRACGKWAP
jgi:RNA recognition motif-containing protein